MAVSILLATWALRWLDEVLPAYAEAMLLGLGVLGLPFCMRVADWSIRRWFAHKNAPGDLDIALRQTSSRISKSMDNWRGLKKATRQAELISSNTLPVKGNCAPRPRL